MRDTCRLVVVGIAVLLLVAACATLAPRLEGRSDPIAWQATDLALGPKDVGGRTLWYYTFELLVREVAGTGLTFNEIHTAIYQPGTGSWSGRFRGVWRLDANDQFRIPLVSSLSCNPVVPNCTGPNVPIPLWRIRMIGTNDSQQPVSVVIDITLPADPPVPPATTSKSARAITLTPSSQAGPPAK